MQTYKHTHTRTHDTHTVQQTLCMYTQGLKAHMYVSDAEMYSDVNIYSHTQLSRHGNHR